MNPFDELELMALDWCDVDTAAVLGDTVREAVVVAAHVLAEALGLDPFVFVADLSEQIGIVDP